MVVAVADMQSKLEAAMKKAGSLEQGAQGRSKGDRSLEHAKEADQAS